jgi:tripartite-type tricarboxylate transporter receptor subunit TctC
MRWFTGFGSIAVCALLALPAANAQTYPDKPIRIIVPVAPGGSADLVARTIGARLSESLGKPVIIESRVGGGGELALESVIRAAPDGYTLLSSPNGPISVAPHVQRPKYDVAKDFTPVAMQVLVGAGIGVNAALPIHSMNDLIKTAKATPEGFHFAHSGVGNTMHLAGELLKSMTGTNLVPVPYRGTSPVVTAILTGEVPFGIADLASMIPVADAGRVRILAVMNSSRIGIAPDVPTVAEAGLPGYAADPWIGLFAPAGTPPAIVERLNAEVARALARPEVRDNFVKAGLQPAPMTAEETRRFVLDDIEKWGKVIRSINLKPQ